MNRRSILASVVLSTLLAACGASAPPPPAAPSDAEPASLQGRVLSDANDVANQLDQRTADLEATLP